MSSAEFQRALGLPLAGPVAQRDSATSQRLRRPPRTRGPATRRSRSRRRHRRRAPARAGCGSRSLSAPCSRDASAAAEGRLGSAARSTPRRGIVTSHAGPRGSGPSGHAPALAAEAGVKLPSGDALGLRPERACGVRLSVRSQIAQSTSQRPAAQGCRCDAVGLSVSRAYSHDQWCSIKPRLTSPLSAQPASP
jgi:hypothetical protein